MSRIPANYVIRTLIDETCVKLRAVEEDSETPQLCYSQGLQFQRDRMTELLFQAAFWLESMTPVDKIYGLYSLLSMCLCSPLPVLDYHKSASNVFEEIVWAWVDSRSDLSILKLAARPDGTDELHLPTWIPAWHQKHPRFNKHESRQDYDLAPLFFDSPFTWLYTRHKELHAATRIDVERFDPIARRMKPGEIQILRARYVGRVSHKSWTGNLGGCPSGIAKRSNQIAWCWLVDDTMSRNGREEIMSELFQSIFLSGNTSQACAIRGTKVESFDTFRTWFDFAVSLKDQRLPPISDPDKTVEDTGVDVVKCLNAANLVENIVSATDQEAAISILRLCGEGDRETLVRTLRCIDEVSRVSALMYDRALCILDHGSMLAIADTWCREGDDIFVFPGTDTPFVVREELNGDCSYRLVGPVTIERIRVVGYQKWRAEGDDLRDIVLL